jgi:hypothetical protein
LKKMYLLWILTLTTHTRAGDEVEGWESHILNNPDMEGWGLVESFHWKQHIVCDW